MLKKIFKIITTSLYVFAIIVIGMIAGVWYSGQQGGKKGVDMLIVKSGSMEPAIRTGSVVFIAKANGYKPGDIITFNNGYKQDSNVTHRIYREVENEQGEKGFETKGDANSKPDGNFVPKKNIIGKTVFAVPFLGYAITAVRTKTGFIAIVIIPAAYIIIDELRKIIRELRNMKRKRKAEVAKKDTKGERLIFTDIRRPVKTKVDAMQ